MMYCFVRIIVFSSIFYLATSIYLVAESGNIKSDLITLLNEGKFQAVLEQLQILNNKYGTLALGNELPSLYSIQGVALHNSMRMEEAEIAFMEGARIYPHDERVWLNLGEVRAQMFKLSESMDAYQIAGQLGEVSAWGRLVRSMGWSNRWKNFETVAANVEKQGIECVYNATRCLESAAGLEYTSAPGYVHRLLTSFAPYARSSSWEVPMDKKASAEVSADKMNAVKRLKLGIVSSDFGIHPVATLIRGAIQTLQKPEFRNKIELYAFALHPDVSWWGLNVTNTLEHFISLQSMNTPDAAMLIASHKIDILIDLNGHTQNSGLMILSHKPAPIQISFLGWPLTTGAPFIDFYLADFVAIPPEHANQFTESLALMNPCYISNDYAQTQGDIVDFFSKGDLRAPVSALEAWLADPGAAAFLRTAEVILATFSNSQKIDPGMFAVWINILRRFPGAQMLFILHKGSDQGLPNLREIAAMSGVSRSRLVGLAQAPWIEHLFVKTSIDLVLDTFVKSGHTTGLDAVWAGIPSLTFSGGVSSNARAGESIGVALGSEIAVGGAFSLKEYEDLAFRLLKDHGKGIKKRKRDYYSSDSPAVKEILDSSAPLFSSRRLHVMREELRSKRLTSSLFDVQKWSYEFVRSMQSIFEVQLIPHPSHGNHPGNFHVRNGVDAIMNPASKNYQIFSPPISAVKSEAKLSISQIYTGNQGVFSLPKSFERRGVVGVDAIANTSFVNSGSYHIPHTSSATAFDKNQHSQTSCDADTPYLPVPDNILNEKFIFLNIGGMSHHEGWFNVNAQKSASIDLGKGRSLNTRIDVVRPMWDLEGFLNDSVSAIYSSHTLEHGSFGDGQISQTLGEWYRVMKAGGLLMVAVPDMTTLARLYLDSNLSAQERFHITRMMFGAQSDKCDYHKIGFNEELLKIFVESAGFCNIKRVGSFNIHDDTSNTQYLGKNISLNIVAHKCYTPAEIKLVHETGENDMMIQHGADEFVENEWNQ